MRARPDQTQSDHDLLTTPSLLAPDPAIRANRRHRPHRRHLHTDSQSPAQLTDRITAMIRTMTIPG